MYKIYMITNLLNNKSYIGLTKQPLRKRFSQHAEKRVGYVSAIKDALRKYGKENFIIEELTSCKTIEEAYKLERLGIRYYDTLSPNGYNIHTGGTGGHISPEMRKKISDAQKGEKSIWYGWKAKDMPWGENAGWNKGIPATKESLDKRKVTNFQNMVNTLFEIGLKSNNLNKNEINYMKNILSDGHFDVVIGFFIGKKQELVYGNKDKSKEVRALLSEFNRRANYIHKRYYNIAEILKEVS